MTTEPDDFEEQLNAERERRLAAKNAIPQESVVQPSQEGAPQVETPPDDFEFQLELEKERRRRLKAKTETQVPNQAQDTQEKAGWFERTRKGVATGREQEARAAHRDLQTIDDLIHGREPEIYEPEKYKELGWDVDSISEATGRLATDLYAGMVPAQAAGIAGASAGTAAGGPWGGIAGGVLGSGASYGAYYGGRQFAQAYQEARRLGQSHDEAMTHAKESGTAAGIFAAALGPIGRYGAANGIVKNVVKQVGANVAAAEVSNTAQNLIAKKNIDPAREPFEGAGRAAIEGTIIGGTNVAVNRALMPPNIPKGAGQKGPPPSGPTSVPTVNEPHPTGGAPHEAAKTGKPTTVAEAEAHVRTAGEQWLDADHAYDANPNEHTLAAKQAAEVNWQEAKKVKEGFESGKPAATEVVESKPIEEQAHKETDALAPIQEKKRMRTNLEAANDYLTETINEYNKNPTDENHAQRIIAEHDVANAKMDDMLNSDIKKIDAELDALQAEKHKAWDAVIDNHQKQYPDLPLTNDEFTQRLRKKYDESMPGLGEVIDEALTGNVSDRLAKSLNYQTDQLKKKYDPLIEHKKNERLKAINALESYRKSQPTEDQMRRDIAKKKHALKQTVSQTGASGAGGQPPNQPPTGGTGSPPGGPIGPQQPPRSKPRTMDEMHQKLVGNQEETPKPGWLQRTKQNISNFRKLNLSESAMLDRFAPIRKVESALGIEEGKGTAYRGARFAANMSGPLEMIYEKGGFKFDPKTRTLDIDTTKPGLMQIFKSAANEKELNHLLTYAVAKRIRTQKLIEQGKEQNLTHADVDYIIKEGDKNKKIVDAYKQLQDSNNQLVDFAQATEIITPEYANELRAGGDYTPLYRKLGIEPYQPPANKSIKSPNKLAGQKLKIKALKGEKKMWAVLDANGNEIGRRPTPKQARDLAADHQDSTVSNEYVGDATQDIAQNILSNVNSFVPAGIRNAVAIDALRKAAMTPKATKVRRKDAYDAYGNIKKDVVQVRSHGKPAYYQVHDVELHKALTKSLGAPPNKSLPRKILEASRNLFSFVTVTNPATAIRIVARDLVQNEVAGKHAMGGIMGLLKELPVELAKAAAHATGWWSDPRQIKAVGMGATNQFFDTNPAVKTKEARDWLKRNAGGQIKRDWYWLPKKISNFIQHVLTVPLTANTMRKRTAALRAGEDVASANYHKLNYMDYNKQGAAEWVGWFRSMVSFLGSHASSFHTVGREMIRNKGFNRTTAKMMGVMAGSIWLTLHNMDEENDPDPANNINSVPNEIRNNYWLFDTYLAPFGIGKSRFENKESRWISWPKNWEIGQLAASLPENLVRQLKGEQDYKDTLAYLKWALMDQLTFDPVGNPIVKTAYEQVNDKKGFTGQPITPRGTETLEPFLQFDNKTSDTSKKVSEMLFPQLNVSPARIDHAVKGIFGALGEYGLMLTDIMVNDKSKGAKPDKGVNDAYIFNTFIKGTPFERTSYESQIYEMYRGTKKAYDTAEELAEQGREKELEEYWAKNEDTIGKHESINEVRETLKEIKDAMDIVRADPDLTGKEKKEQLDEIKQEKNQYLYEWHRDMKAEKEAAGRKK